MLLNCPGEIIVDGTGAPVCVDPVTSAPVEWEGHVPAADFTPDMIDAAVASEAFAAGFAVYAAFWVVASGVILAVKAFKKM